MNILEKIAADKKREVAKYKELVPVSSLEKQALFDRNCISLKRKLETSSSGIIAEFKRKSPSLPELNLSARISTVVPAYEIAGASGISVLTDRKYFGGSDEDLLQARQLAELPLLKKDFIIDPYQIFQAKATGADVILLIAAILSPGEIKELAALARSLSLEVLLEVHDREELQRSLLPEIDMIGVNNRNLKNFSTDLNISRTLSHEIPNDFVKISESGIESSMAISDLRKLGYRGFLIGGTFMHSTDPGASAQKFINSLKL